MGLLRVRAPVPGQPLADAELRLVESRVEGRAATETGEDGLEQGIRASG